MQKLVQCRIFWALVNQHLMFASFLTAMPYAIRKIWQPDLFQGHSRKDNYFEGWYFKMVDATKSSIYAVIPGIAWGKNGQDSHAFIQLINGQTCETHYFRYDTADFRFSKHRLEGWVGDSFFSKDRIALHIHQQGFTVEGEVQLHQLTPYPVRWSSPGIMGWYAFVPGMECYHGLVSMHHRLSGQLCIQGQTISMENGVGYLEKDWGSSMPACWVWMQCNHFDRQPNTSLMVSLAKIPWMGHYFPGYLAVLWIEGQFYTFTTYTGARITRLDFSEKEVLLTLADRQYQLEIHALRAAIGELKAPVNGLMERRIQESIAAKVSYRLLDKKGHCLAEDTGDTCGLEVVGDVSNLLAALQTKPSL